MYWCFHHVNCSLTETPSNHQKSIWCIDTQLKSVLNSGQKSMPSIYLNENGLKVTSAKRITIISTVGMAESDGFHAQDFVCGIGKSRCTGWGT